MLVLRLDGLDLSIFLGQLVINAAEKRGDVRGRIFLLNLEGIDSAEGGREAQALQESTSLSHNFCVRSQFVSALLVAIDFFVKDVF